MGNVVMRLKVMPSDIDVNLDEIADKIKALDLKNVEIRDIGIKPIAFGLKALVIAAVMPDEGSIGDELAEKIQQIDGVESVEIESVELL
ncbi:MAG: elongation factor 1-beta [Archaeoglobales archaeon]|nr:MAG: elongation factor 1-beta [Archaeoglobales archaeon]